MTETLQAPRILQQTTIRDKRTLYGYLTATFFVFVFTLLATSIATFLIEKLPNASNPIFYVGVLLGLASFFALFVDTVWSSLQDKFSSRTLMFAALIGVIVTVCIFLLTQQLFVFALLAAFLYGWSYDLYDVTMLTTILRNGDPEKSAQNISQKRVAEVLGMISGLLLSGPLLYFGSEVAQMILIALLATVLIFVKNHFDKAEDAQVALRFADEASVDWKEVFFYIADPHKLSGLLTDVGSNVRDQVVALSHKTSARLKALPGTAGVQTTEILKNAKIELVDILQKEHHIISRGQVKQPQQKSKVSIRETWHEVMETFRDFFALFRSPQGAERLLMWGAMVIIFFSFWDTMAITFQPLLVRDFFNEGWLKVLSGFILALFVLPILVFQIPISKGADRIGHRLFVMIGLAISGVSLFFLATAVLTETIWMLILAGMGNSIGYAFAFAPAQAYFTSTIKKARANITDAQSAGTLRIALNVGNIAGQILGGTILAVLDFSFAFYFFSGVLIAFALFSVLRFGLRDKAFATHKPTPLSAPNIPDGTQMSIDS